MEEEKGWIEEDGRMAKERGFPYERCLSFGCIQ